MRINIHIPGQQPLNLKRFHKKIWAIQIKSLTLQSIEDDSYLPYARHYGKGVYLTLDSDSSELRKLLSNVRMKQW